MDRSTNTFYHTPGFYVKSIFRKNIFRTLLRLALYKDRWGRVVRARTLLIYKVRAGNTSRYFEDQLTRERDGAHVVARLKLERREIVARKNDEARQRLLHRAHLIKAAPIPIEAVDARLARKREILMVV